MMSLLLTLLLTLRVLVSLLLTLNIFHILNDVKYVKIQILHWKKKREVIGLTDSDFKLKCFSSQIYPSPRPSRIGPLNLYFVRIYARAY